MLLQSRSGVAVVVGHGPALYLVGCIVHFCCTNCRQYGQLGYHKAWCLWFLLLAHQ